MKRTSYFTVLCLLSTLLLVGIKIFVRANPELPIHNIDTGLDYATIQEAIDANETLDGHTIHVDAGTYYENVVVLKSLSLIGENRTTTIIDGNYSGTVVRLTTNNISIANLTIQNSGALILNYMGIYISEQSTGNNISYNIIRENDHGISVWHSSNNSITGNEIIDNSVGIALWYSSHNNTVFKNEISSNNYYGIWLNESENNTISENVLVANAESGIELDWTHGNSILNNTFVNDGLFTVDSYENDIEGNMVNGKPLVYLEGISDYVVENAGQVILVNSNRIQVEHMNLTNTTVGVELYNTNNTVVTRNNITANNHGVELFHSSNNTIFSNYIVANNKNGVGLLESSNNIIFKNNASSNNWYGILLDESSNNTISENDVTPNLLHGIFLMSFSNNNTISLNKITAGNEIYIKGILLDGSSNNQICENSITDNDEAIHVFSSSNYNSIYGNNIVGNRLSIVMAHSSSNNIIGNRIVESGENSMFIYHSFNNFVYHNNFLENFDLPYIEESANSWDNGVEGNYWGEYSGVDADSDGIGDTAYEISTNNVDHYPLTGMFSDFNTASEHNVQTICNSTISDFQFNGTAISFTVSGQNGTTGFCRICIPTALMNGTYRVFVNGTEILPPPLPLPCSNSTHSYLYFSYTLSTKEIVIVPEFPSAIILPLFMLATLLAVIVYRRRHTV